MKFWGHHPDTPEASIWGSIVNQLKLSSNQIRNIKSAIRCYIENNPNINRCLLWIITISNTARIFNLSVLKLLKRFIQKIWHMGLNLQKYESTTSLSCNSDVNSRQKPTTLVSLFETNEFRWFSIISNRNSHSMTNRWYCLIKSLQINAFFS